MIPDGVPHHVPAASDPPSSSRPIVAMEAKEGRIGNAFACERCRKHKVRCVPSDTAGICQRCQKARVECVEHVARRRPAKPRAMVQTPNRVAEMEKKLDKLSAIVTATTAPTSAPQPTLPPVSTLPSQVADIAQRTPTPATAAPAVQPALVAHVPKTPILPNPGSTPESALSFWESINDTIAGLERLDPLLRQISVVHMQLLWETYRSMIDFFPFVTLPKDSFSREMIQQRSMLTFAVLTVASHDSSSLQLTLSREFRKIVMVKMMKGEKSLDLLQGLLVFIAWHHHYMDPHAVSLHMLLQMCIGMAGDLGLDNIPSFTSFRKEDALDREAKRAYLGCYFLSTNIAMFGSSRSPTMLYSSTIRTYAADLASSWEHRSDAVLPSLIETCQFMEDVEETFQTQSEQTLVIRSQTKRLSDRWDSMRIASKQLSADFKTLQWLQLAARVHFCRATIALELLDRDLTPLASGFQLSLRITHLRAIEQFLDNTSHLHSNKYDFLTIVDWLNVIFALTALGNLVLHISPIPGWDPADLQLAKTFEQVRDQICSQLPQPRDGQERKFEDVFERFRRITATMKMALRNAPGRGSPNGSTFEITTSSRQTVSLLQESPTLKPNSISNATDLPTPWKTNAAFDMSNSEFPWKFLMGTV